MKGLIVVLVVIIAAIEAQAPYGVPPRVMGINPALGSGGYQGASGYGSQYGAGATNGYQGGVGQSQGGYDQGGSSSHFRQITDASQSTGHNRGGGSSFGAGGEGQSGYGRYGMGYGNQYNSGFGASMIP